MEENIVIYQSWVEVQEVWREIPDCAEWSGFPAEFGPWNTAPPLRPT